MDQSMTLEKINGSGAAKENVNLPSNTKLGGNTHDDSFDAPDT